MESREMRRSDSLKLTRCLAVTQSFIRNLSGFPSKTPLEARSLTHAHLKWDCHVQFSLILHLIPAYWQHLGGGCKRISTRTHQGGGGGVLPPR